MRIIATDNGGDAVIAKIIDSDNPDVTTMRVVRESVNHFCNNGRKFYTMIADYKVIKQNDEISLEIFTDFGNNKIICENATQAEKMLTEYGLTLTQLEENFKILTNEKPQNFSISLPKENFTETALKNFKLILESKANLIKSAIGIEKVDFEVSADKLNFNWFDETPSAEEIQAYSNFICKVGELAKKQKRVTAKEREVENKRYAFRCFLLRIGLIGEEFKNTRKILLEKLVGNCAFKGGQYRMDTLKTA